MLKMVDEKSSDVVSDVRLASFLKRQIRLRENSNPRLINLKLCGSQVIKQLGAIPAVFLLSDGEKSRFFGHTSCHSAWSCPKCMPIVMAQKGTSIACAIDALAKWYDEYAFMITFTLPHSKYMSCKDSATILKNTWRAFTKHKKLKSREYTLKSDVGRKNKSFGKFDGTKNEFDKRAVGKAGEKRIYTFKDPYGEFRTNLNIQHSVRVYEFTWSELNGWHPHIHALFWTKKANLDKVLSYESDLLALWWRCAKNEALKYWNRIFPDKKEENKKHVEDYYTDWRMQSKDGHKALFISRDRKNPDKVDVKKSSYYISGWSGDAEVTSSNFKKAREGHLTPYQMLQLAYNDARLVDKFIPLYLEYCITTFKSRRVEFSKTGINTIIKQWKQTREFETIFKKKRIMRGLVENRKFKVVYWFNEKQWRDITTLEMTTDEEILAQILTLAKHKDCRAEIDKLLESYDIMITEYEHVLSKHIEERVFENRMSA